MASIALKISPWIVLAFALLLGGISVMLANLAYPYVREKHEEAKREEESKQRNEEKVRILKTLIADEALRNVRATHRHLLSLKSGSVKISPIDFSALDTTVNSGLASSLDSSFFQAVLNAAYALRQAKHIHEKLSSIMLSQPTPAIEAQRKVLEKEYEPYLVAARTQLISMFSEQSLGSHLSDSEALSELREELIRAGIAVGF